MKRLIFALALALVACGGKKDENPSGGNTPAGGGGSGSAPAPAGSGNAPAPAGSGSAPTAEAGSGNGGGESPPLMVAEVDVPTEVDFEEEAQQRITEKNLDAELKAVEEDLASN
ncbi:MAG: hypothetical protein KF773_31790 [Deltaproteobacteria bacterium]|nr:hypothetical protein [Deltaproteobacteria bacterium]